MVDDRGKKERGEYTKEGVEISHSDSISEMFASNFTALQNYVQWDEKPHKGKGSMFNGRNGAEECPSKIVTARNK